MLELQNKAQTFIDGALHARRQGAGMLGQETAVERISSISTKSPFRGILVGRDAMLNPSSRAAVNTLHSGAP
jgi:hypothetical protein